MQSTFSLSFLRPRSLFLAAAATVATCGVASAEIVNQLTVSGTLTYPTESQRRQSSTSITNTQKLVTARISNSTFLERMAADRMIPYVKNYQLVEILTDEGEPIGIFAYNSKSGDAVEAGPSILNVFYENTQSTRSDSDTLKFSSRGNTFSFKTDETGVSSGWVLGNPAHTFFTSKIDGQTLPFFDDDTEWQYSKLLNYFDATLRGVTEGGNVFDIRVKSSGARKVNVYLEPS